MKTLLNLGALALLLATINHQLSIAHAQATQVTYQGRVTVGGQPFTGTGQFKFALVDAGTNTSRQAVAYAMYPGGVFNTLFISDGGAGYVTPPAITFNPINPGGSGGAATATVSGGAVTAITINNYGTYNGFVNLDMTPPPFLAAYTTYWSHDGTSAGGAAPTGMLPLAVANGLFTVALGDTNLMAALPAGVMTNANVRLRMWFNNGTNGFAQLTPDQPLTAAPYALVAERVRSADSLAASQVTLTNAANVFSGSSFSGNGAGLTAVNATTLGGVAATNFWKTTGNVGTTPGANFIGTTDNQRFEVKVNGERAWRVEPASNNVEGSSPNVVGGYLGNVISNGVVGGFIGGGGRAGYENRVGGDFASVVGGVGNLARGYSSTAMGLFTTASGRYSTAMGGSTTASDQYSTAMGYSTTASGYGSTAMGLFTTASGDASTAMGNHTTASGAASTAMGSFTTASGDYSTAMGKSATATHDNSFIWSDGSTSFSTVRTNSFNILASGGIEFYTGPGAVLRMLPNGTSWTTLSDQNAKKNFTAVSGAEVLEKLASVPVQKWNYKWEKDSDVPNIGPMAQAFKHAFYPGRDDKGITTLEFDGVELAAIQGLNQKLEQKETEITELKQQLAELKVIVNQLVPQK